MKNFPGKKTLSTLIVLVAATSLSLNSQGGQSTSPFVESNLDPVVEKRIDKMISTMTLDEKLGQMSLRDWLFYEDKDLQQIVEEIKQGRIGGFLNVPRSSYDPKAFSKLQKVAVEQSRLGIPLIFGHDVIHGYKTIFPIPLGQAASWNPSIIEQGARVAAKEATSAGIRWTFAPMIDIPRDPRWGRMAESLGEDVFLTSTLGAAMVKGFQGDDLTSPDAMAACAKHFAGEEGLVLLAVDAEAVDDDLAWEVSRGDDLFPHLYRNLKLSDVVAHWPLPLVDGVHVFPKEALADD